jgi:acyl carrier protein
MSDTFEIQRRVTDVVTDVLQTRIPSATTDLIDAGILDSLGFVELIARIESEFGFRISLDSVGIDQFRSIESIAAFVHQLAASATACSR